MAFSRDIYYNDPALFGSQRVVDRLVDDLAYTIGVDRAALHVVCAVYISPFRDMTCHGTHK